MGPLWPYENGEGQFGDLQVVYNGVGERGRTRRRLGRADPELNVMGVGEGYEVVVESSLKWKVWGGLDGNSVEVL